MSIRNLIGQLGTKAVAFATRSIVGAVLPGAPVIADVAGEVVDWLAGARQAPAATNKDLEQVQTVLGDMAQQLNVLTAAVARCEGRIAHDYPDRARTLIDAQLRQRVPQSILDDFQTMAERLDCLERSNRNLLQQQQIVADNQANMLCLLRRMAGIADFVRDLRIAQIPEDQFVSRLHTFQKGERALASWQLHEAQAAFSSLEDQCPQSSVVGIGLGTTQLARGDAETGLRTLGRTAGIGAGDASLAAMIRDWPPTVIECNRLGFRLVHIPQECRWVILEPNRQIRHRGTRDYIQYTWRRNFADRQ